MLNIAGLGIGLGAFCMVMLWVADERRYNAYNRNYDRLGLLYKHQSFNGSITTTESNSIPLAAELRALFGQYFDEVVVSSFGAERVLRHNDKTVLKRGYFMEKGGNEILDLQMVQGAPAFPLDPTSVLLNEKTAFALFGTENPLDKIVKIDNKISLKVAGVYKNIPQNSSFRNVSFYADFEAFANMEEWVRESKSLWEENSFPVYVKLAPNVDFEAASKAISGVAQQHTDDQSRPELFVHPMPQWRFYPAFADGRPVATGLKNLIIVGSIGFFILLLAVINFVNLITARASVKAKEIGVRKSIGSTRRGILQMVYAELALLVLGAGLLGLLLAQFGLVWLNRVAQKTLTIDLSDPVFMTKALGTLALVGLLAGIYPALYLSSFSPIKILRGFKVGSPKEAWLRKSLVVFQFSISVALIIAMLVINRQITHTMNRPMGYDLNRLVQIQKNTPKLRGHFWAMREQLLASGGVEEMAEMNTPLSENWHNQSGIRWRGRPENSAESFGHVVVTPEFGQTVNWTVEAGRDFNRRFKTDTSAVILNRSAANLIGFKNPLGEQIEFDSNRYTIIGITGDIIFDSPYENAQPTVFFMRLANAPFITLRLAANLSVSEALGRVERVVQSFDPEARLNIKFADAELESKFWREKMMLEMISVFTAIAIFICCLGLFGLVTFMAERRTREIGIRKVLGASVAGITGLLARDFLQLVLVAILIACPVAYFLMHQWLQDYAYRIELQGWMFAAAGAVAVAVALLTVGFQSVKAALANPVKSLRSE
jgi:ABC-type antimicrobial peptide transport system permease subunit